MDDPRRTLSLRTVGMLRELARKWWRVEVGLTDSAGRVPDGCWAAVPLDGNDFCRVVRSSAAGRRGCSRSIREIQQRLRHNPRDRSPLTHTCHLGLGMAAAAIHAQGRERGLLFTCGFATREQSRTRIHRLRTGALDLGGRRAVLDGERVPVLAREDLERLRDLLEYAADEIAAFETGLVQTGTVQTQFPDQAFDGIVARSAGMRAAVDRLMQAAALSTPVLLQGEAGTGKRALARALHLAGPRRAAPFEVFDPSADPQTAESRLFGMSRGGSLGKPGVLEVAASGTVYLSSGSWLSPALQIKLLRFIQEGTLVPLGAERCLEADTRLVFGSGDDLEQEIAEGRLRRDLAERLAGQVIAVPALRQRREDMAELIDLLLRKQAAGRGVDLRLPAATVALLTRYHWPGNVTELEEELRQLAILSATGRTPSPEQLSVRIRQAAGHGSQALTRALKDAPDLKRAISLLERELIHEGLVRTRWNKSRLARQLGISRSNLLAKMARYGLDRPETV